MQDQMNKGHKIKSVERGSIAEQLEIEPGDLLVSINGSKVGDIFDYHYLVNDCDLTVVIQKFNGEEWELDIEKDYETDLGIAFEQGLMDQYRSCRNKCMFCFIDQMPPGMRETLYFKDDDARLSFLQGNYITLTNLGEEDLERILQYKLSPINISVHTTNPGLRCKMLSNRFAGEALDKMKRLAAGGIRMNSQIVLCKGYNDGEELERSIADLSSMLPHMQSLSVVPVGLTKYRRGLVPLEKFSGNEAAEVLNLVHGWQERLLSRNGTRFVFASDEWYLTAGRPIPCEACYEGYGQLENGVGMVRSLTDEFERCLDSYGGDNREISFSVATGVLFAPILTRLKDRLNEKFPNINGSVYAIRNEFFGEDITVAGLLTGQDIIKQLKGKDLGGFLLLPQSVLRNGEDVLLDDITINNLERALQIDIRIVQSDGISLIESMLQSDKEQKGK